MTVKVRHARVTGYTSRKQVEAYLPHNYDILSEQSDHIIIQGIDAGGWTLDDYVIPRLGSGLMGCVEVTGNE